MLNQRTCKPVRQLSDRTVVTPFDSAYTHKQICTWLAVVRIKVLGLLAGLGHDGSFEQTVDWVNLRAGIKAHSVNEASFSSSSLPQTPRTFHSFLTTAFISAPLKRKHTSSHTELCSNFWQRFSRINNNKACVSRPPELLFTCAKNYCSQSSCAPITPPTLPAGNQRTSRRDETTDACLQLSPCISESLCVFKETEWRTEKERKSWDERESQNPEQRTASRMR